MAKPSWDEYFMEMVGFVMKRADCIRGSAAAVVVRDFRVISTGYNGTPHRVKNCSESGCIRCKKRNDGKIQRYQYEESCICIHAEQNALIQAAYLGISTKGATLYTSHSPCSSCAKLIINAGIKRVVYKNNHHDEAGKKLLIEAGVEVENSG